MYKIIFTSLGAVLSFYLLQFGNFLLLLPLKSKREKSLSRNGRARLLLNFCLGLTFFSFGCRSFQTKSQTPSQEEVVFHEQFPPSFDVGVTHETWLYVNGPSFIAKDGIETIKNGMLNVRSTGLNQKNEPFFTLTVPQNTEADEPAGTLDHLKWSVATNHTNQANKIPGFATVDGKELVCETIMRGQTFNTSAHPFGKAADRDDVRLASIALTAFDAETFTEFDFLLTNDKIYALYERQPEGRGNILGNYAAFTYVKELKSRKPNTFHQLSISYDRAQGIARWLIDGKEVFKVTEIGKLLGTDNLTLNFGGDEPNKSIKLNQLNCGMAHFTLLDAFLPTKKALVRLSGLPGIYHHPITDKQLRFVDEKSLRKSRLFGQGVSMDVKSFKVKYMPSKSK